MNRFGRPVFRAVVSGDWETVISAREYREQLIDQKPFDEQLYESYVYLIECKTTADLVAAYRVFGERLKLHCEFEASFVSDDTSIRAEFSTGVNGDQEPRCYVVAEFAPTVIRDAAKQAVQILEQAMK